jgi:hypothetical protein
MVAGLNNWLIFHKFKSSFQADFCPKMSLSFLNNKFWQESLIAMSGTLNFRQPGDCLQSTLTD